MTVKTRVATAALALLGAVSLVVVGAAPATVSKGKPEPPTLRGAPKLSATPVFKLRLKPSQEVPPVTGLRADAVGSVTFDLERSTTGAIISGEVVFYVNYAFPSSVTITGLHVHQGGEMAEIGRPGIQILHQPLVPGLGEGQAFHIPGGYLPDKLLNGAGHRGGGRAALLG